jgi:hypothetical protein
MSDGGIEILQNLIRELQPVWPFLHYIAYLIGACIAIASLKSFCDQNTSKAGSLISLIACAAMLSLPTVLDSLALTLFGKTSLHSLSYTRLDDSPTQLYINVAVYLIQIVGIISIIKAFYMMTLIRRSNDPALSPRIWSHLIGGICCVNPTEFIKMLGATVGGEIQSSISALIS